MKAYEQVFNEETQAFISEALDYLGYLLAFIAFMTLAILLVGLEKAKGLLEAYLGLEEDEDYAPAMPSIAFMETFDNEDPVD